VFRLGFVCSGFIFCRFCVMLLDISVIDLLDEETCCTNFDQYKLIRMGRDFFVSYSYELHGWGIPTSIDNTSMYRGIRIVLDNDIDDIQYDMVESYVKPDPFVGYS